MPSTAILTAVPRNVRIAGVNPDHLKVAEGDVFNVCQRITDEVSPDLRVVIHEGHPEPFVVMEDCADGEVRFVARYAELDQRILEDLRRMRSIPFTERWAASCKAVDEENAKRERDRWETEEFDRATWHMRNAIKESNL